MGDNDVKPVFKQEGGSGGVLKQKAISFAGNVKKEDGKANASSTEATRKKVARKKKKSGEKKSTQTGETVTTKKSDFKGGETKMNGHVFQLHDESNTPGQFTRTKQELSRFVQEKYPHGHDIVHLITMQEECDINANMPEDLKPTKVKITDAQGDPILDANGEQKIEEQEPSQVEKELWKEDVKAFGEQRRAYGKNKKSLWALIIGQCSPRLISHLESIQEYKTKY